MTLGTTKATCMECETTWPSRRSLSGHAVMHPLVTCPLCDRKVRQVRAHFYEEHNAWLPLGWEEGHWHLAVEAAVLHGMQHLMDVLDRDVRRQTERMLADDAQ